MKRKNDPTPDVPAVDVGDAVFFQHPELGPHHGHIHSKGTHGCHVKDADGQYHKVPWDQFLGLKGRAHRKFKVIASGEAGAIVEDPDGGRRFIKDWQPEDERDADKDGDLDQKDLEQLREEVRQVTGQKPMTKALPNDLSVMLFRK